MDIKKIAKRWNKAWVGLAAAIFIPTAIFAAQQIATSSVVTCQQGGCEINIQQAQAPVIEQTLGASQNQDFTDLTALRLSGDLQVSGTSTVTGTSTFSGDVVGVTTAKSIAMTNTTSTACSLLNSSGVTRMITSIAAVGTASTNVGTFVITAGTSTGSWVTSTSPLIQANLVTLASKDIVTTTSTLYAPTLATANGTLGNALWLSGEYLNFKSSSTTLAGTCRVSWY